MTPENRILGLRGACHGKVEALHRDSLKESPLVPPMAELCAQGYPSLVDLRQYYHMPQTLSIEL